MKGTKKAFVFLGILAITIFLMTGFSYGAVDQGKVDKAKEAVKSNPELVKVFSIFMLSPDDLEQEIARFDSGKEDAEKKWLEQQANLKKIQNLGSTKSLEILPLIDWKTSNNKLKGEPGVAYLIKTDHTTILFDVGFNQKSETPSPLMDNMEELGITLNDFDSIVISHDHLDHVGGWTWNNQGSFSLDSTQIDLKGKKVFAPTQMSYPGLEPVTTEKPTKIAEGVTTIGAISNFFFFMGETPEQALAVNVKKLGIVLIVGCGHQTVEKIIDRAKVLFNEPIYAIIGGLHFPITDSRLVMNGIKIQKYVGIGRYPWQPFNMNDVKKSIDYIKKVNPKIVAISAHDSCDASLDVFKEKFGGKFRDVVVGNPIVIGSR